MQHPYNSRLNPAGAIAYNGLGRLDRKPVDQPGSWAWVILPFIEQDAVYRAQNWGAAIKTYICVSRRPANALPAPAECPTFPGWRFNSEGHPNLWARTDYTNNRRVGGTAVTDPCWKLTAILDGASQTLLVGEKAMDVRMTTTGTWYFDEPAFSGGQDGVSRQGTSVFQDMDGEANGVPTFFQGNWGSAHPGAAQILMCDGSVRDLKYGSNATMVNRMLLPTDGEVWVLD